MVSSPFLVGKSPFGDFKTTVGSRGGLSAALAGPGHRFELERGSREPRSNGGPALSLSLFAVLAAGATVSSSPSVPGFDVVAFRAEGAVVVDLAVRLESRVPR